MSTNDDNSLKKDRLGTASVPSVIVSLAIPAIIAQIISALYNIVDRIYISMIPDVGDMAMTGVGVCFPILILVSAFAQLIGTGGSPLAVIHLGKNDRKTSERILGNGFVCILLISLFLTVILQLIKYPILMAFGASEATVGFAVEYLSVYLMGTVFVQINLGLNLFIAGQGKPKVAMLSILIGAGINIILDPIFIFTLDFGVKGAAIATVISQAASAIWIVCFLASRSSTIRLKLENFRLQKKLLLTIMALGVSPFVMQLTECLVIVLFNSGLQKYGGDYYVGAMTIISSVMQLIYIFANGLTQGVQPVISFNYGARLYDRVRTAYRIGFVSHFAIGAFIVALIMVFPAFFASLFTTNQEIVNIVVRMMPIFVCGWGIFGIQSAAQCAFVGLGQAKAALFLTCLRKVILLIPLVIVLPNFLGVLGIFMAEPIADITSALTAGVFFKFKIKRILQ
jgi:putative efflux protein, MATE family